MPVLHLHSGNTPGEFLEDHKSVYDEKDAYFSTSQWSAVLEVFMRQLNTEASVAGSGQEGPRTFPAVGNWPEIPEGQARSFSFDLSLFLEV